MKVELEISEKAYKLLRREVYANALVNLDGQDIKTYALMKMFKAWDNNETAVLKTKDEE